MTPASELLLAFTITMQRIGSSPQEFKNNLCLYWYVERERDESTRGKDFLADRPVGPWDVNPMQYDTGLRNRFS
jgi:hypothetical protein